MVRQGLVRRERGGRLRSDGPARRQGCPEFLPGEGVVVDWGPRLGLALTGEGAKNRRKHSQARARPQTPLKAAGQRWGGRDSPSKRRECRSWILGRVSVFTLLLQRKREATDPDPWSRADVAQAPRKKLQWMVLVVAFSG